MLRAVVINLDDHNVAAVYPIFWLDFCQGQLCGCSECEKHMQHVDHSLKGSNQRDSEVPTGTCR